MPATPAIARAVALSALFLTAGCAGAENAGGGFLVVQSDITYGPHDQRVREWRALMAALDRCHGQGYADAQAANPPETRCIESGPEGCRRTLAHLSFDCIGMGYQPN